MLLSDFYGVARCWIVVLVIVYQLAVDDVEIYMISSDESDEDEVITINSDDEEAMMFSDSKLQDVEFGTTQQMWKKQIGLVPYDQILFHIS